MNSLADKIISVLNSIDESKVNPHPEIDRPLKVAAQLLEEGAKRENAMLMSTGMFSNTARVSPHDVVCEARCEALDLFAASLESLLGDEQYHDQQFGIAFAVDMARMVSQQYSRGELMEASRTAH